MEKKIDTDECDSAFALTFSLTAPASISALVLFYFS